MRKFNPQDLQSRLRPSVQSLTYASTLTPGDPAGGNIYDVGTLTGSPTLDVPAGTPANGDEVVYRFTADGGGGYTITWAGGYAFGTDLLSTDISPVTASKSFEVTCRYHSTSSKWRVVGLTRGY
jgi:hypothetical protein